MMGTHIPRANVALFWGSVPLSIRAEQNFGNWPVTRKLTKILHDAASEQQDAGTPQIIQIPQ
jgi:hypothetical protein